jgi:hypothetical protein
MDRSLILSLVLLLSACAEPSDAFKDLKQAVTAHGNALQQLPKAYYRPGLGDLMQTAQIRHQKLWFAGTAQNWELAAFEIHELQETLERIGYWHNDNTEAGAPMSVAVKAYTNRRVSQIASAVATKDSARFESAFDALSEGCNSCHAASEHEFIVIQRPSDPALSNQLYAPLRSTTHSK